MTDIPMTDAKCSSRRRAMWQTISVILTIVTLMSGGVAWAMREGNAASRTIELHSARQNGTLEKIDEHLLRIDQRLERIEAKQ